MFRRVLIANRGEIARRVAATCRTMGISVAVVYADADADAPHVHEADVAVRLPGHAPADTYLDVERIVAAARAVGADALHPGYGFLAENATLARRCGEVGVTFVGPRPEAIERMGSKTEAKRTMADAGVPMLPSAELPADADVVARAADVGYPLLVKASAGGGGKAMRIVEGPDALIEAVDACRREARAAFGDDAVFLERYLVDARHVEIQVFGDAHGTVVHLGERECSVQRRYQKVVEESPSPVVSPELRAAMGAAAVAAAQAIDYVGAGTVEFLLDDDGRFSFLEMNTRLQVEHPVTELVTGLDLVRLQLLVAAGDPLPAAVRDGIALNGHAVEARLYAEDPDAGFLPATGTLHRFDLPDRPGLRVDAGVVPGSVVSVHYDPMLAKVIAHAPTRSEALALLAATLQQACIDGVVTNQHLLVGILRHPAFVDRGVGTSFLDVQDPATLVAAGRRPRDEARSAYLAAAAIGALARERADAPVLPGVRAGFRSTPAVPTTLRFAEATDVAAEVALLRRGDALELTIDGEPQAVELVDGSAETVDLIVDGVRRRLAIEHDGDRLVVRGPEVALPLRLLPRFSPPGAALASGSLAAPMPGTVIRVDVAPGDVVASGASLVVLEAMKMEHTITSAAPGTVGAVEVAVGAQVLTGDVLVVVELDEEEAA